MDVQLVLAKVAQYISSGVELEGVWDKWFPVNLNEMAEYARKLPLCRGVEMPETPVHGYDPFSMSLSMRTKHERSIWLVTKSFAFHSEARLTHAGFTPQASKMITYFRVCLVANGCGAKAEKWQDVEASLSEGVYPLQVDSPALDQAALTKAKESWAVLVLTLLGAYIDANGSFGPVAEGLCADMWMRTPWPKLLEEHDLTWGQIIQCVACSFSPRALLMAVVHNILVGLFPQAPIYDVVHYTIRPKQAMPMISPWGPPAAQGWWKVLTAYASHCLNARKLALRKVMEDLGEDVFPGQLQAWIHSDMNPFVDLMRIMSPIILATYRPMYMPHLSCALYLDRSGDEVRLMQHAKSFAEMIVSHEFNQQAIERSSFDIREISRLGEWMDKAYHRPGTTLVGSELLILTGDPGQDVKPWQFPSVSTTVIPDADTMSATLETPVLGLMESHEDPFSAAHLARPKPVTIEDGDSSGATPPIVMPVRRMVMPVVSRAPTPSREFSQAQLTAFQAAKAKLVFEEYTDDELWRTFTGHSHATKFGWLIRSELKAAAKVYNTVLYELRDQ